MIRRHRLLAVIAHPDDEATFAGTLALAARAGADVSVVCTTNGGGGVGSREVGHGALARRRRQELVDACAVLGVHDVEFYEPADSEPHLDRRNYAAVADGHRRRVVQRLQGQRPDVVITFGPEGVTGHASHVQVGALTDAAVAEAGVDTQLFHVAFSGAQVAAVDAWLQVHPEVLGAYADEVARTPNIGAPTPVLIPVADDALTAAVDVTAVLDVKRAALARHESQGGGGGILDVFCLSHLEHFTRIEDGAQAGAPGSVTDLLALDAVSGRPS